MFCSCSPPAASAAAGARARACAPARATRQPRRWTDITHHSRIALDSDARGHERKKPYTDCCLELADDAMPTGSRLPPLPMLQDPPTHAFRIGSTNGLSAAVPCTWSPPRTCSHPLRSQ